MTTCNKNILSTLSRYGFLVYLLIILISHKVVAQCPANINFETGTFNGWQCWLGSVDEVNSNNVITLNSVTADISNHIMLSSSPGDGVDPYGGFPKNCPNGSGHSIQLGNELNGHLAEAVSYQFTIPATANKYKLLVNYAIVLQDPDHSQTQQPRFEMETMNITDNIIVPCSSPTFIAGYIPGLKNSGVRFNGGAVSYRDWAGISINLDGNAGKTFRIFFRTAGCTYIDHFCYAYIDVNSNCDGSFESSAFCPADTAVNLKAPLGFKTYTWFNNNYSQILGTDQTLHLSPLPPPGSTISVELTPYNSYGCTDTLTTKLSDTLTVKANAGADITICNGEATQIGVVPLPDRVYQWTPSLYLSAADISNPIASPPVATEYELTVKSEGGGCVAKDTMKVFTKFVDNNINITGKTETCIGFGPLPVLKVNLSDSIQWFKDSVAVTGATQVQYTVTQTGKYYAQIFNNTCPLPYNTKETAFVIDAPIPGTTYPVVDAAFNFPEPLHARQFGNSVQWSPAISLSNPFSYAPTFTGLLPQLYTVEIKTATGCITVDTQIVKTHKKIEIYVPTAFTPDGNGINEKLRPLLIGFTKVNYFRIYDRWGKLLFTTNNDQTGWDGKINNIPAEIQTVVWTIEAVDVDGKVHNKQGTTVLYR
ncbi:MAG: T9SS type B sorting domain-containing protein [Ferruginibacter sp.]